MLKIKRVPNGVFRSFGTADPLGFLAQLGNFAVCYTCRAKLNSKRIERYAQL
jgi:hypothetical protein